MRVCVCVCVCVCAQVHVGVCSAGGAEVCFWRKGVKSGCQLAEMELLAPMCVLFVSGGLISGLAAPGLLDSN